MSDDKRRQCLKRAIELYTGPLLPDSGEEHWVVDLINTELTENSLQEEEYYDVCSPKVYKFKIITDDTGVHIKDDLENNELVYNVPNNTTEFRTLLNKFDSNSMPIGMQLIGKPFNEKTILTAGNTFQGVTDFHLKKPALV